MKDQGQFAVDGGGAGGRPRAERREIGAFYTPPALSAMLADWALRTPEDTVLEPSFGGCGFLMAARDRLQALGAPAPQDLIYGCDIDPVAFDYVADELPGWTPSPRLVPGDFLACKQVDGWPGKFSAVLANPPYIRHQKLSAETRQTLASWTGAIPNVKGRAGLWAYFLSHAIEMLELGGRMAWVLPGAMMQADYAQPIRHFLAHRFDRCAAFIVHERLFLEEGTDEETVIVLTDGLRADPREDGRLDVDHANTLDELRTLIRRWDAGDWDATHSDIAPALIGWPAGAMTLYNELKEVAMPLGDLASVSIGLVTGANDFFVLSRERAQAAGLTEADLTPVLPKFKAAQGARFTFEDHATYLAAGKKALLVSSRGREDNDRLTAYLDTFDKTRRSQISTFRKRACWSETCDGKLPSAFFPVMHHSGPRLVLNDCGCFSTNTVHRVLFHGDVSAAQRQLAALSMATTFSQISGEIVGRRYGSGVLKHEPRDAERIHLLMPAIDETAVAIAFDAFDAALRRGAPDLATEIADETVISAANPVLFARIALLRGALETIRKRRRPVRRRTR